MTICCNDCGLPYDSPRYADFVVPDEVWKRISPTGDEGGILCAGCMFGRMAMLNITCDGRFTSGPCADHNWRKPPEVKRLIDLLRDALPYLNDAVQEQGDEFSCRLRDQIVSVVDLPSFRELRGILSTADNSTELNK